MPGGAAPPVRENLIGRGRVAFLFAKLRRGVLTLWGNVHSEITVAALTSARGRPHALCQLHRAGPSDCMHARRCGGDSFATVSGDAMTAFDYLGILIVIVLLLGLLWASAAVSHSTVVLIVLVTALIVVAAVWRE